jgi:integrase/recombinase XerD
MNKDNLQQDFEVEIGAPASNQVTKEENAGHIVTGEIIFSSSDDSPSDFDPDLEQELDLAGSSLQPVGFDLERAISTLCGNIALSTRRIYRIDALHFNTWLVQHNLTITTIDYEVLSRYRQFLADNYAKPTASRMLVVARRLLDIAVILKLRPDNPATQLKGFKGAGTNETTHRALTKAEAHQLLSSVDRTTNKGKRDYALLLLLLRTGLRRAEAADLTLGDIASEQGHNVLVIQHGKGDKRRRIKLPVDVHRVLQDYLASVGSSGNGPTSDAGIYSGVGDGKSAPVFVSFIKGDKPRLPIIGLGGKDIERIVEGYAKKCGLVGLSPHGLRASFVTLTLEGGAKLQQVQYAAGHSDPATTERYQKRKFNLDDNATDYLKVN